MVAGLTAEADWAWRVGVALVVVTLIVRVSLATLLPLRPEEPSGPAVDVIEPGGVPLYVCTGCGTQLVLLRKGNDKPPRHCGEPMTFKVVAEPDGDDAAVAAEWDVT